MKHGMFPIFMIVATSLILACFTAALLPAAAEPPALDKKNMDLAVRPGDDFFRYANGAWIRDLAMPADKSEYDAFDQVREQNRARLHELFQSLAAGPPPRSRARRRRKSAISSPRPWTPPGSKPWAPPRCRRTLTASPRPRPRAEIQDLVAGLHRENFPVLFGAGVEVDLMNAKAYAFYLAQSGLGMPDRDYYTRDDADAKNSASSTWPT